MPKVVGRQAEPQFPQLVGNLAVPGGFFRLAAQSVELCFDFVDDVRQPQQVLVDPLEPPVWAMRRMLPGFMPLP